MITVRPSKKSNMQSSPKKCSLLNTNRNLHAYITVALVASLIGTYLDLLFVGMGIYAFPVRLFPEIFSINIIFTLLVLPVSTILFLATARHFTPFLRFIFISIISTLIYFFEQIAEQNGWFTHHETWTHMYSFFGYMLFLVIVWKLFCFFLKKSK